MLRVLQERESTRRHARSVSRPESARGRYSYRRSTLPHLDRDVLSFYSVSVGSHPSQSHRNRYLEVEPYNRTRVVVRFDENEMCVQSAETAEGWYLNASWVLERFGGKWWIATQAPLPGTAHAFLSLILQTKTRPSKPIGSLPAGRVRTVVQLTQNVEDGFRKADTYFPSIVGQSRIVYPEKEHTSSALKVTLLHKKHIEEAKCVQSTVSVVPISLAPKAEVETDDYGGETDEGIYGEKDGSPITFRHLLFYAWPDHGVPRQEDRACLLNFIRLVDKVNRDAPDPDLDPDPPIIVGCSAGIGRTGSFIVLCSLLRAHGFLPPPCSPTPASALPTTPLGPLPSELQEDLAVQEIDSLRDQRPGMVQRPEQVLLVYDVLKTAFTSR